MVLVGILVLQLLLVPALTFLSFTSSASRDFRVLHVDYPKATFAASFHGYCNGLMSFVRTWIKDRQCPWIHYVLHAPWTKVTKNCKHTDSFCETFNKYCSTSHDAFNLTTCNRIPQEPPNSCLYNETISTQRVYLLCSRKYNGEPTSIIGLF